MISIALSIVVVFFILVIAERFHKQKKITGEAARKIVHIAVASFVATWPFYLSVLAIELMCLAFVLGIFFVRYSGLFGSIHDVDRKTWGDLLFPLGIGVAAIVSTEPWIFSAAVLHLGLADGVAAIIGTQFKHKTFYKVFGERKSIVGTFSFFAVSSMIVIALVLTQSTALSHVALPVLLWLPLIATAVENVAPSGTDNLLVPFVVASLLNVVVFPG